MKRAIGYIRVSTARQELSPDAQRTRIEQFAAFNGYEVSEFVIEPAISGRTRFEERDGGMRALALLETHDAIIFAKLSRAFRNAADALTLVPKLLRSGKDALFLDIGVSVSTPTGKMVMGMLAVQAEWEADIISERTREALGAAQQAGKRIGGVPFGLRTAARMQDGKKVDGGLYVPVPAEQEVIASIRALRSGGNTFRACAAWLNAQSVPAPRGDRWYPEAVRRVMRRIQ